MAVTPVPAFTVDAAAGTAFGASPTAFALPGTPASDTVVRVANLGSYHLAVQFGTTAAAAVLGLTLSTGLIVPAGTVQYLALPTGAAYIGGVVQTGASSTVVNIATGN